MYSQRVLFSLFGSIILFGLFGIYGVNVTFHKIKKNYLRHLYFTPHMMVHDAEYFSAKTLENISTDNKRVSNEVSNEIMHFFHTLPHAI
jgi:hypothetical protein